MLDARTIEMLTSGNFLGAGLVIFAWIMTALIKAVFRNKKDKEISAAESIFILNKTVAENTVAMVRLTTQMEYVSDAIRLIPEIRRDVDGLGSKSRKLESDLVRLKEEIQGG